MKSRGLAPPDACVESWPQGTLVTKKTCAFSTAPLTRAHGAQGGQRHLLSLGLESKYFFKQKITEESGRRQEAGNRLVVPKHSSK